MTAKDLVLLLLGALVGAVVASLYNAATGAAVMWRRRIARFRRERAGFEGSLSARLVKYYRGRGLLASLYVPRLVGPGDEIALLHDETITVPPTINVDRDEFVVCDHQKTDLPVNKSAIAHYKRLGARLFDGEFLFLKDTSIQDSVVAELRVGRVNFFAYASLCFAAQRQIMSRWRRRHIHDRYMRSFRTSLNSSLRPRAIGGVVALLVHRGDDICVAVARRSTEVVNGPGTRSLAPVFGFECHSRGGLASKYGLTFYNIVREYIEEFFDLEEVVYSVHSRRIDPDWIFHLPPAALVQEEVDNGRVILTRTGLAMNPNDGVINIAMVAHFTSPEFFARVFPQMKSNFEMEGSVSAGSIEFVKIDDGVLDELVAQGSMDPSSVFALDLARAYVAGLDSPV